MSDMRQFTATPTVEELEAEIEQLQAELKVWRANAETNLGEVERLRGLNNDYLKGLEEARTAVMSMRGEIDRLRDKLETVIEYRDNIYERNEERIAKLEKVVEAAVEYIGADGAISFDQFYVALAELDGEA